jgi:hypothetical protein
METDMKYPYVAPTTTVVVVRVEAFILQSSGSRGGYGEEYEI